MPKKRSGARKTNVEREAEKQAVKTLYYAGQSLLDAAEAVGVSHDAARQWAVRDGWTKEIQAAKSLVQSRSQAVAPATRIAFDRAKTGKMTRNLLSKAAFRMAREVAHQAKANPLSMFEDNASNFKQLTEAAAKIDGSWEDSSANRFAVSLNLNAIVQSGAIREIPPGAVIEEE